MRLRSIAYLGSHAARSESIFCTAALGFDLGWTHIRDDARLGIYTGAQPQVYVIDRFYGSLRRVFEEEEPAVEAHIRRALATRYRLAFANEMFQIYVRTADKS